MVQKSPQALEWYIITSGFALGDYCAIPQVSNIAKIPWIWAINNLDYGLCGSGHCQHIKTHVKLNHTLQFSVKFYE